MTDHISTTDHLTELAARRARAVAMGGSEAIERHRRSGRLPVRERIDLLVDPGSWFELGLLALPELRRDKDMPGDAVVTGFGRLDGRTIGVIGIDSTIVAGTTAPVSMRKQGRLIELAQRKGFPIVLLCDADGGRIPDVMGWRFSHLPLDFTSFLCRTDGGPVVPRAAAILGPSYGDSALHAATAHFAVMVKTASVALVGPSVIEPSTGEKLSDDELGGPDRALETGNAHFVVDNERQAMDAIAAFLSYLPANSALPALRTPGLPPRVEPARLAAMIPAAAKQGYDVYDVIDAIVDASGILPWGDRWGGAVVTCLARLDGRAIGVIASQPMVGAGALDAAAMNKIHAFVDMCDTFGLPLVFLQDVPGLMVGAAAERSGVLKAYEGLALRLSTTRVPKIVVILRKAYGGGHFALGGRPTRPDFIFAWPTAELGFMAPDTGIRVVHRRRIDEARSAGGEQAVMDLLAGLDREWRTEAEPWEAAANIAIDDIIDPAATRDVLLNALAIAVGPLGEGIGK